MGVCPNSRLHETTILTRLPYPVFVPHQLMGIATRKDLCNFNHVLTKHEMDQYRKTRSVPRLNYVLPSMVAEPDFEYHVVSESDQFSWSTLRDKLSVQ